MDQKSKIVIATVSWARNEKEKKLILDTLSELDKLGLPIILTDQADSRFPLIKEAKKLKNVQIFREKTLYSKVKRSFTKASEIGDSIFYTESDKLSFVKSHARDFINQYLTNRNVVLLSARSNETFQKLPRYQKAMEHFLAITFGSLTNKPWVMDISYGPRIFSTSLVKYLKFVKEDIGFGWQAYLLTIATRLGIPIRIINYHVESPEDIQDEKEVVLFRMKQAGDYFKGYEKGMKISL